MGNWKKIVAAVSAVPMLAALAPSAAIGAEPTTLESQAAQQALAAALKQNDTKAADSDLLASLDFNDVKAGATGDFTDSTSGAKATINGTAAVTTGKDGTTAAQLGSGFWLNLTKGDGTAVLKGQDAVTISYDSKSASTNQGWSFYAAPNGDTQKYQTEHYLGVMDRTTSVGVERYNNAGKRDSTGNVNKADLASQWRHVDIVIDKASSTLYIDGAQAAQSTPADGASFAQLTDILGADGGIIQIGKANWVNGEYYTGALDNLKVYGSAHTADQIKSDYDATKGDSAKADANALTLNGGNEDVYSDITLPETGSINGSKITWKSSDAAVITDAADAGNAKIKAGVVTRQQADTKVTLTATITDADGNTATKDFTLNVKAAVEQPKTTDYVFAHFTGTEGSPTDEQIYFATSQDGLAWHDTRDSGDPILTWDQSQTGNSRGKDDGVRDPYLVRSPEGDTVYLIATELSIHNRGGWGAAAATSTGSTNLIIWQSHDFVNWSKPYAVDVASKIPGAGMAWAPEAYWDDVNKQYMVYWATASDADNESGDRTNMYYSTTRDFVHFTDPVKWIDRSRSVIDTTMIKADDGYYYRVSGDTYLGIERSKDPYATTLTTGADVASGYYNTDASDPNQWTLVGTFGDLTGTGLTGAQLEGPELFFYSSDDIQTNAAGRQMKYGIMWDQYSAGKGYTPYRSADLGSTDKNDWGFASDVNFGALKKRHGTILPVSTTEYNAVMKAFDKNSPIDPVTPDDATAGPIAAYDFADGAANGTVADATGNKNDLTLKGAASTADGLLTLDGTNGTYAELPKGLLDGRNKLTVQMDVKSDTAANLNQFTFAFGKSNAKYYFMRYRNDGSLANHMTTTGNGGEKKADTTLADKGAWHKVTVTFDDSTMTLYVDGEQKAQVTDAPKVSDLGADVLAYLGKSFYGADGYFKGSFDNVKIWNRVVSAAEVKEAGAANPSQPSTPTEIPEVLADLTFDDLKAGATGDITDQASNAKATIQGTAATGTNDKNNTTAAKVSKDFWLNVTKSDGTPLLKGVNDLTVSFDAKPDAANNTGWAFYAAPNTNAPVYNKSEHYLGVMATPGLAKVERYNTEGNRDTRGNASGSTPASGWYNVTVTVSDTATRVYVNGALAQESTNVSGLSLTDILGEGGGILQLGKANWGSGEYYSGLLDNVKIYSRVLTDKEIEDANPVTLQGITVGTAPTADEAAALKGTDDHSLVRSSLDWDAKTVTTVLNRRGDATKVPVKVSVNRSNYDAIKLTLDGEAFTNGGTADLTKDRKLTVDLGDGSQPETWTLKAVTVGSNPVLPGQYADPDIDYFDGKFWIFPTTDGFSSWSGNYFHAWSSTDLQTWNDEGVILDVDKSHEGQKQDYWTEQTTVSPWSVGSAWAPTIEKKVIDGQAKYFFYYCAKLPNGQSAIGVAVATNPAGPYKAADQPIVTRSMEGVTVGQAIDPSIFTDPATGKSYITYGNGSPAIAELSDDMMSVKPGTVRALSGLRNFRESVVVAYRDGKYHWTWSADDANSPNYHVEYGVSDSIDGAITYKGVLLQKDTSKQLQGTAHQSDVHVTDADGNERWFMAYHRHYTPLGVFTGGLGYHRETAIDEIHFGEDGLMQVIKPTDEGVGAVKMADITALKAAISAATALGDDGSAYTAETWDAFVKAKAAASEAESTFLAHGLSQADVDAATKALTDAQAALKKVSPEPEPSSDASLKSLSVAGAEVSLDEAASADGASLEVADPAAVTDADVAASASDKDASVKVAVADGVVTVTVTAADGTTTKAYTVKLVKKAEPAPSWRFTDVVADTPHASDIQWLADNGISTGWKTGETDAEVTAVFSPMGPVVRQDMAAFLYRLAGSPAYEPTEADKARFTDVTPETPHYKEILWLASKGIAKGFANGDGTFSFGPMRDVVRQDMAAFLRNLADAQGAAPALGEGVDFTDVDARTPHSAEISWLAQAGVTTGWQLPDGTSEFRGMNVVVRQDMAAFLHRMSTNVLGK